MTPIKIYRQLSESYHNRVMDVCVRGQDGSKKTEHCEKTNRRRLCDASAGRTMTKQVERMLRRQSFIHGRDSIHVHSICAYHLV